MKFKRVTPLRFVVGMAVFLPLLGILLAFQFHAVENFIVTSGSMEPTLAVGDRVIVRGIRGYFPDRDEIVALENPKEPGELLTKRVIGLPGDEIRIRYGILYVNGQEQIELFLEPSNAQIHVKYTELTVPTDNVFVLGDNRNRSYDSLDFGPVPLEKIRGPVRLIYWPPGRIRRIP